MITQQQVSSLEKNCQIAKTIGSSFLRCKFQSELMLNQVRKEFKFLDQQPENKSSALAESDSRFQCFIAKIFFLRKGEFLS